jgi:hypothetical protein
MDDRTKSLGDRAAAAFRKLLVEASAEEHLVLCVGLQCLVDDSDPELDFLRDRARSLLDRADAAFKTMSAEVDVLEAAERGEPIQ